MATEAFHLLETELSIPAQMNDPFNYEAHPLCLEAIRHANPMIQELMKDEREGKMFGVLVVEDAEGKTGFLVAYSGQIKGRFDWPGFVPAVFDYLHPDGHFKQTETEISTMNREITWLENNPERKTLQESFIQAKREAAMALGQWHKMMYEAREQRRALRAEGNLSAEKEAELIRESQFMKAEYRRKKKYWEQHIEPIKTAAQHYEDSLDAMKKARRTMSDELQQWLFNHFNMLNAKGERRNLIDLFRETSLHFPPSGAGECCEPKLLQYAYENGLRPVQIAMFWVGPSPKVEIRHQGRFYPACRGKCMPILRWMLSDERLGVMEGRNEGVEERRREGGQELPILFEDNALVVVDKPAGLLSVPGISEYYSVWSIIRNRYPEADSPFIVHRLDQPTSGLLVLAKTRKAHRTMQLQFERHEVRKRYIALLEKPLQADTPHEGTISLPLYSDPLNRPYQNVDEEKGKSAVTDYQLLGESDGHARVALFPKTGRTHQLRVHCAHQRGLNNPILGDNLYGQQQKRRLFLHASDIWIRHPETGEEMHFHSEPDY